MNKRIASVLLGVLIAMTNIPVARAETIEQTDTSAPTLASITPLAGNFSPGTVKVSAQGVYDPSGVQAVSFVVSNAADPEAKSFTYIATNTADADWTAVFSTTDLGDTAGTYTVSVNGTDALGNQGVMGTTSFTLSTDVSPPTLQSLSPQSGTVIDIDAGNFTVQANVEDSSGVKAVSFTVYNEEDGQANAVSLGAAAGAGSAWSQQFSLSSFGYKAGKYTIEVWAMDTLGNTSMIGGTELTVKDPSKVTDTDKAEAFIQAAMSQLGKTYVLGGKGPNVFDCSGLVYYALKTSGYQINYMTSAQWALSSYQRVNSMSELQRGDVICFKGHVGIYLGNGLMVNASASNGSVIISTNIMSSAYWQANFLCGRRVF